MVSYVRCPLDTLRDVRCRMKSAPRTHHSMSNTGYSGAVDASLSSPSLSPPNQASRAAHSAGGQHPASSARSLPAGVRRAGHSTPQLLSSASMHRTGDRYAEPPSQGGALRGAGDSAPVTVAGQQGGAVSYFRTGSGSQRGASGAGTHRSAEPKSPSPAQVGLCVFPPGLCLPVSIGTISCVACRGAKAIGYVCMIRI